MTFIKTTISISSQDRQFIDGIISSGEFVDGSEYMQNLIHKDKKERRQIESIRTHLMKAEQSGFVGQSAEEMLADFKDKAQCDGK